MALQVEVVSVEREVWSGEADMVVARTTEGEVGVLPGHAPLLGELAEGAVVRMIEGGVETTVAVHGGFLSVTDQGVSVLAEIAEMGADVDVARARAALDRVKDAGPEDLEALSASRRAQARLRAAGQDV